MKLLGIIPMMLCLCFIVVECSLVHDMIWPEFGNEERFGAFMLFWLVLAGSILMGIGSVAAFCTLPWKPKDLWQ